MMAVEGFAVIALGLRSLFGGSQMAKKKKWWFEVQPDAEDIEYSACLFCGSFDYDMSDGEVHEVKFEHNRQVITVMRYVPKTCDQCAHGWTNGLVQVQIH